MKNLFFDLGLCQVWSKTFYMVAFVFMSINSNAQIFDDIESYDFGPIYNDIWDTWFGEDGQYNGIVDSVYAFSGEKSVRVGAQQDVVIDLGNVATDGVWVYSHKMLIPSGSLGYLTFVGSVEPSASANTSETVTSHFHLAELTSGVGVDENTNYNFPFPHDEWFDFTITVNMDSSTYQINVDSIEYPVQNFAGTASVFGGVNMYAVVGTELMYIDDVNFYEVEVPVSVVDPSDIKVSLFPTIFENLVFVETELTNYTVRIFDLSGKEVFVSQNNSFSSKFQLGHLGLGKHIVHISSGDLTENFKIIKQ